MTSRLARRRFAGLFVCAWLAYCLLTYGALSGVVSAADSQKAAGIEYFEQHIRPVLVQACYECHSSMAESIMGELRVDTRQGLLAGGANGPSLVPGDAENSLLIRALRQDEFEMPPDGKLSDSVINHFVKWVEMGAPMPAAMAGDPTATDDADSRQDAAESFWAFQPPVKPSPPETRNEQWPVSEVDRFILARVEEAGLQPVSPADRQTLIRRVYFDLWGLPPSREAVQAFLEDSSPHAYERLVDRLLESPRFGERWGRHWLDVARYAESTGHERNFLYPHAWRYRDYVISAFNQDKPYDRFVVEQIAGDLLPAETSDERDEQRTATGFLAIGPRNLLGSNTAFALDTADDQINVTARAIMGLTVSCARCHDHKFDPISTEEYYSLAGIFLSTETLYGTRPGTGGGNNRHPAELVPLGQDAEARHEATLKHQKKVAALTSQLGKAEGRLKKLTSLPKKKLSQMQDELSKAKSEVGKLKKQIEKLEEKAPEPPMYAMGVRESQQIQNTAVRISGSAGNKGAVVPRGVLDVCTTDEPPTIAENSSGRLELAHWLTSPSHPLTSRVMVNRIWRHLFGRGLVPTVDNFGLNGQPPSHPQLLDWLAIEFQQEGWSVKRMIRQIMLSRVYQLSSQFDEVNHERDPDNIYLWRSSPRRLEAEVIRDSMLASSGQLELEPPQNGSVIATLGDGCLVRQINPDKLTVPSRHRSVYLPNARFFEPEILQVFDGASASLVVGDRAATNVPAQALFLLNNDFVIEQARHAADQLLSQVAVEDDPSRVESVYWSTLSRSPTDSEHRAAKRYLQRVRATVAENETAKNEMQERDAWAGLFQALYASGEFRYVY